METLTRLHHRERNILRNSWNLGANLQAHLHLHPFFSTVSPPMAVVTVLLNHPLQTPRKANSQAPHQTYWIELWAGALQVPRWCRDIQNLRTHWFLRRRHSLSNALIVAAHWNHPEFKTYKYLRFWAGACGSMLILKKILWGFYGSSPQNDSSEADGSIHPSH